MALIAHTAAGSTTGSNVTTPSINTTGATLLVGAMAYYTTNGATFSDSAGNAWTYLPSTGEAGAGSGSAAIVYCSSPITNAAHTFTASSSAGYPSIAVQAWSATNSAITTPVRAAASGLSPGSGTPAYTNEILVTMAGTGAAGTFSVDAGFTITDQIAYASGACYGVGFAYLVQTSAVTESPAWSGVTGTASVLASFETTSSTPAGATNGGAFFALLG